VGVALLALTFIAITAWWLAVDQTPPDGDASRHLHVAFDLRDQFRAGHELFWFRFEPDSGAIYPPVLFVVGGISTLVGGLSADTAILGMNLVFVPLLALGCYGIGRVAFDRPTGLLAAIFAFATPVVIGQFHIFMFDIPLSALVAVTTWLLLASDHFGDRRLSLLAGAAAGVGMLMKQPFVVFIAPVAAVMVLRGGYRNWRNVLLFAAAAALIAAPWYLEHLEGLRRVTREATAQGGGTDINPYGTEFGRWEFNNYYWYGWTLLNVHYWLPLTLFYLAGLGYAAVSWLRTRRPALAPELIVGSLAGYVGVAMVFGFQDARYSVPALAFVAVLGVGWIRRTPTALRIGATAALVAVLVINSLAVDREAFGTAEIPLWETDSSWLYPRLVVADKRGYSSGKPDRSARVVDVLRAAQRDGIRSFSLDLAPQTVNELGAAGLSVSGRETGVALVPGEAAVVQRRSGMFLSRQPVPPGGPKPCTRFDDGTGLYVFRGATVTYDPRTARNLYCPL
jgi:4-amino-4-deoxy-L-arabinose transferase-like glycosyltransferase